jgi:hypothetical protein
MTESTNLSPGQRIETRHIAEQVVRTDSDRRRRFECLKLACDHALAAGGVGLTVDPLELASQFFEFVARGSNAT